MKFSKKSKYLMALGLLCSNGFAQSVDLSNLSDSTKVIYGKDDRLEVYEANASLQRLAGSTAVMIANNDISEQVDANNNKYFQLNDQTLAQSMNICKDQRFANQPSSGMCSGFLVGPDLLVTAGHCMNTKFDCEGNVWVFDFKVDGQTRNASTKVSPANVFKCKEIINYKYGHDMDNDFSIIELDRVVENRSPLKIRTEGEIKVGEKIVVIGHPSGLPSKISGGATVRSTEAAEFFVTNLDTFGGNSGSAVFNEDTKLIEGILVRGERDYVYDAARGCRVVNECKEDECRGEDVTRIDEIKELMFINTMMKAIEENDERVVADILKMDFNPNMHDNNLRSPLILAAQLKRDVISEMLIERGADITKKTAKFSSALEIFIQTQNKKMIMLAIEKLDLNSTAANEILKIAVTNDDVEIMAALLDKGLSVDAQLSNKNLLLGEVVKFGASKISELLIERGANLNQIVDGVRPLLHQAINKKMLETAKLLIDRGVNINQQSQDLKNTALHEAIEVGMVEIVDELLALDADLKALNIYGLTPGKYAKKLNEKEIAKKIRKERVRDLIQGLIGSNKE